MAELSDIVTLTTISSTRANLWQSRLVQRYSSVANRTSEHPSPSEGDLSYLEDSNSVWVYDGSSWLLLGPNLEVDGSVEVASTSLTATKTALATVNLTIPTTWASWKCEAHATFAYSLAVGGLARFLITIDGTDQQEQLINTSVESELGSGAVGGRRTGITTTGSRSISLRAYDTNFPTSGGPIIDIYLYARATRTS